MQLDGNRDGNPYRNLPRWALTGPGLPGWTSLDSLFLGERFVIPPLASPSVRLKVSSTRSGVISAVDRTCDRPVVCFGW